MTIQPFNEAVISEAKAHIDQAIRKPWENRGAGVTACRYYWRNSTCG